MSYDLIVIGGGAGGCYGSIRLAEFNPGTRICILESARKPLSKVEISGGGRCNVTHACFDHAELIKYYPRGGEVLLEPFRKFQPSDMVRWFHQKGVQLKTESDGRMFPVTDDSATIIECFMREIRKHKIELRTGVRAIAWNLNETTGNWNVSLPDGKELHSKYLLIASGSDQRTWDQLHASGHTTIKPVPSLFTFNIRDKTLQELMGVSKPEVHLSIPEFHLQATGPLLITHWGLSGPAILKLSAWGARHLYSCDYVFDLQVNWLGVADVDQVLSALKDQIAANPKRQIANMVIKDFSSRLWKYICQRADLSDYISGAEFGKKQFKRIGEVLTADRYRVTGKSTYKDEFVTAGGVALEDIDILTFESKKQDGLYLVGEVLNIDALTGGFNFQSAWTGAYLAAKAISRKISTTSSL